MKHYLSHNTFMHVSFMDQFFRVRVPQFHSITQVNRTTNNQAFIRMPVYTVYAVDVPVECFAGDELFVLSLLLNIQNYAFFIRQSTYNFILSRSQAYVLDAINSGIYLLAVNITMVELFQHLNERKYSFLIRNQDIPAVIKALNATHSCRQFVVIKLPVLELIDSDEVDVSSVGLLVVAQHNKIAILQEMHMHKFLLWLFGHVFEAAQQVVSEFEVISVGAQCHEGLVIIESMMEGVGGVIGVES